MNSLNISVRSTSRLIAGIKILGAALFVLILCFAVTSLFPPYDLSPSATNVLKATADAENAIQTVLAQNRNTMATIKSMARGDSDACKPLVKKKDASAFQHCVAIAVQDAELHDAMLEASLIKARNTLSDEYNRVYNAPTQAGHPLWTPFDQAKRFFKWIGPGGFVSVISVLLVLWALSSRWFWTHFRATASVPIPFLGNNVTLNFSNVEGQRTTIADTFQQLDGQIKNSYQSKIQAADLDRIFRAVKTEIDRVFKTEAGIDLDTFDHRATLYVPGFLLDELIQATLYLGKYFTQNPTSPGRRFSSRFGIIGMSWRLQRSLYNPKVSKTAKALIRRWGFTAVENSETKDGDKAMLAFAVKTNGLKGDPLGVIYLDTYVDRDKVGFGAERQGADDKDGMSPDDLYVEDLWAKIAEADAVKSLVNRLESLKTQLNWDEKIVADWGR
jgi:hypothetical protein